MIAAKRPTFFYQLGLTLAATAMLVLPCLYVALTAATIWGVYYFAVHCFPVIWSWPVGHSKFSLVLRAVCSVTPLLVGGIVALFMVKPFFAPRVRRMCPLALNPDVDQRVYALVQGICQLLGAKAPERIELDCSLNAGAGFDGGIRGLVRNRLVLVLGLPLVAGLTQRELAGVIAHEFGHFRQGFGMRLSYLIRSVNHWFARVVYERDAFDESLESAAASSEGWQSFMILCARAGVGFSRSILWVLMMTGNGITAFLLRQMEYDADAAEVELAGTEAFESTTVKLEVLGLVLTGIHLEMRRSWRNHSKLPDNLPWLVGHKAARLPAEKRERITNTVGLKKTGWFDSHPSAADRVKHARKLAQPGYEISDEPAEELFENFQAVSKIVTLIHYEDDLNVPVSEDFLIPVEQIIAAAQTDGETPAVRPS